MSPASASEVKPGEAFARGAVVGEAIEGEEMAGAGLDMGETAAEEGCFAVLAMCSAAVDDKLDRLLSK